MPSIKDLQAAFKDGLGVDDSTEFAALEYSMHEAWDSVAHMQLIATLESKFDIMIETNDVIDMSSFPKAIEILSKYDVRFDA
jgi:acyl carrier protein